MKKAVFGWITIAYLFDTENEIKKFKEQNYGKGWYYNPPTQEKDGKWYMEVCKPYGKYNPGW